jgi:hypothetical protein
MKSSCFFYFRQAFVELKREVAKKAVFSRTEKPIPEKIIVDWEDRESTKNKLVNYLMLVTRIEIGDSEIEKLFD